MLSQENKKKRKGKEGRGERERERERKREIIDRKETGEQKEETKGKAAGRKKK